MFNNKSTFKIWKEKISNWFAGHTSKYNPERINLDAKSRIRGLGISVDTGDIAKKAKEIYPDNLYRAASSVTTELEVIKARREVIQYEETKSLRSIHTDIKENYREIDKRASSRRLWTGIIIGAILSLIAFLLKS